MTQTEMYEKRLRDVIRPDVRSEREDARSYTVADYIALGLKDALSELSAYSYTGDKQEIAEAYCQYINQMVYDERRDYITLFAHTHKADEVLHEAGRMARGPFIQAVESEDLFDA